MSLVRLKTLFLTCALVLAAAGANAASGSKDQEMLNQGKILIFDKKWEEARNVFHRVVNEFPASGAAAEASYYIARCFQFQGRETEAIRAYEEFLQKYPNEPFLPAEAKNAVVEIAASLMEKGNAGYKDRLAAALISPDKNVRYFAAIRSSRIGDPYLKSMAVPVLRDIVKKETESELVDRAKIALLRLDPKALAKPAEAPAASEPKPRPKADPKNPQRMFHLVVYQAGSAEPRVELNLPVSLAQLAIAALDESAKQEIRKKGFDIDNIWEASTASGPRTS